MLFVGNFARSMFMLRLAICISDPYHYCSVEMCYPSVYGYTVVLHIRSTVPAVDLTVDNRPGISGELKALTFRVFINETFDFILDSASLYAINLEDREKYVYSVKQSFLSFVLSLNERKTCTIL